MKILSSLRSRIFLASALLAVLCIVIALYFVNVRVTQEAERTLEREIVATAAQIDQLRAERSQTYTLMARLIADLPKLKAAIDTNDPSTVEDIASGYQSQLHASLLLVTNHKGQVLYSVGGSPEAARIAMNEPAVRDALGGKDTVSLLPRPSGILQIVTVPVLFERPRVDILGTLSAGFLLDDALAMELKTITGSDLAFGMDGRILASTLGRDVAPVLAQRLSTTGISHVQMDGQEYAVLPRALSAGKEADVGMGPVALILRSRTEQLQSLKGIRTAFAATGVVAIILAMVLSFTVARTIVRPLAAITNVMREVAATGDLTRKIAPHRDRWQDEDARLLATTFNTLTDSIARFQREMAQKERLTSLGRLSTVIAHEVRNPLMIIKASLHTLRQPDVSAESIREVVADIDEEVVRLNRIVNEVLDFARPIRFERAPADLNALCVESAAASEAGAPGAPIQLDLDPQVPPVRIDVERMRIALVNVLVNARDAANGRSAGGDRPVTLSTSSHDGRAAIVIADRGAGISPDDLPRVFDPYFTTKRGGTGLGLAIAKNVVEGLGGTIAVTSTPGVGTEIRIEFPTI